jgi:HPt (histidine-containing phosphotransfer) domain-containing protein
MTLAANSGQADTSMKGDAHMELSQSAFTAAAQEKEIVHVDASFAPLMPKFMTNRKKEVIAMREALAVQDFETVRSISHGMKGAGGSYGFDAVSTMAATIEVAAKQRVATTIDEELSRLGFYLERIEVIFDEEVSGV